MQNVSHRSTKFQVNLKNYLAMFITALISLLVACQPANETTTNSVWSGFLEGTTLQVSSEVGGRITSIAVQEGDVVQPGQTLATLDDEMIRWRIEIADANVAAAEAQLKLLEIGARTEDLQRAQARVEQARAAFLAASQAVTDTEAIRTNPQALLIAKADAEARAIAASYQLTATVKQAQAADQEVKFWEDQNRSLEQGVEIRLPTGATLHFDTPSARLAYAQDQWNQASHRAWQAWAAVDLANANALIAKNNLNDLTDQLANPIALDNRVNQARAARDKAQANWRAAEAALQLLRDGASPSQLQAARAALDQAKAARATLDQEHARHTIVAPSAGIVKRVVYRVGEIVAPTQAIVQLSSATQLKLRVFVSFAQVEKIRVGEPVTLFVSELNNRKLAGTVTYIADTAEFSGRQAQTDNERNAQLVAVEIAVKDADEQVKPGMPATAIFGNRAPGLTLDLPAILHLPQAQTFSGSLEAKQTRVASELSARAIKVQVKRGDVVRTNDVLIELDGAALQSALSEAQAAVRAAQSNVDQVNEPARPGTIALAQAGVAQAQADLQAARAALDSANRTLKSPQEWLTQLHVWEGKVIAAQGEVKRAEATLAGIQSQIEIAQQDQSNLGKTRLASLQYQREGAQANLLAAQTTLSGTQRVVELYRQTLAQPLELIAAQHAATFQVQVAEAGLNVAQAELAIAQRSPQKEAVALAEAKLRAARASLEIVQAQLNRTTITSPMDAQVVGRNVEPGETVRPGVPLIVLADPRELEMTIYVPIRSMGMLKEGQTGTLKLPSIPGKSFTAKITYIAPEAEFKPANIYNSQERSEMVFAVRVTVPNPSGELKAGLPADVTFQ